MRILRERNRRDTRGVSSRPISVCPDLTPASVTTGDNNNTISTIMTSKCPRTHTQTHRDEDQFSLQLSFGAFLLYVLLRKCWSVHFFPTMAPAHTWNPKRKPGDSPKPNTADGLTLTSICWYMYQDPPADIIKQFSTLNYNLVRMKWGSPPSLSENPRIYDYANIFFILSKCYHWIKALSHCTWPDFHITLV